MPARIPAHLWVLADEMHRQGCTYEEIFQETGISKSSCGLRYGQHRRPRALPDPTPIWQPPTLMDRLADFTAALDRSAARFADLMFAVERLIDRLEVPVPRRLNPVTIAAFRAADERS